MRTVDKNVLVQIRTEIIFTGDQENGCSLENGLLKREQLADSGLN